MTRLCESTVNPPQPPTCPITHIFDPITQSCIPRTTPPTCPIYMIYDIPSNVCRPLCPIGTVYSPTTQKCIIDPNNPCPSGYVLNSLTQQCEPGITTPEPCTDTCLPHEWYNPFTFECVEPPELCPPGTKYNPWTGLCQSTPLCPPNTIVCLFFSISF